jgi:hypothetical protein
VKDSGVEIILVFLVAALIVGIAMLVGVPADLFKQLVALCLAAIGVVVGVHYAIRLYHWLAGVLPARAARRHRERLELARSKERR